MTGATIGAEAAYPSGVPEFSCFSCLCSGLSFVILLSVLRLTASD